MSSPPQKSVVGTSNSSDGQEQKVSCKRGITEKEDGENGDDSRKNETKKPKLNFSLKTVPSSSPGSVLKTGSFGALKKETSSKIITSKKTSVFGDSDDDDVEEMPAEARMRMKNIGRDTPTSAGPNSFGKTRQGFCDAKKVFERQLKKAMDETGE